jgi:hypothetical protein
MSIRNTNTKHVIVQTIEIEFDYYRYRIDIIEKIVKLAIHDSA